MLNPHRLQKRAWATCWGFQEMTGALDVLLCQGSGFKQAVQLESQP